MTDEDVVLFSVTANNETGDMVIDAWDALRYSGSVFDGVEYNGTTTLSVEILSNDTYTLYGYKIYVQFADYIQVVADGVVVDEVS